MLSQRLLELRKKSNFTQAALSARLKIARTTYSGYERGTSEPDNDTLEKIADYYGVTIDYLLGREPKEVSIEESEMESMKREIREIVNAAQTDEDVKSILHIMRKVMKE